MHKPKTIKDLKMFCSEEWTEWTFTNVSNLVNHHRKRLSALIQGRCHEISIVRVIKQLFCRKPYTTLKNCVTKTNNKSKH